MRNIALALTFDGSRYAGWQSQNNAVAIANVIEAAIREATGETVRLIGCSRTDAGVHAARYVANFKSDTTLSVSVLPRALNFYLPKDIAVFHAAEMPEAFHAQLSATKKEYVYMIENNPYRNPLNPFAHWETRPLDLARMQAAAARLVGTHDFAAFANAGGTVLTSVRTIYALKVTQKGTAIRITVQGNGFLYNMVRILAGTLVAVGRGALLPEDIPKIIDSRDRKQAGKTLPARGLTLRKVWYGRKTLG